MSSLVPLNPTANHIAALLPKLNDADADLRYMSLNDLVDILKAGSPSFLLGDYNTCARTVDGVLKSLIDQNGEVQSQAIKCLGPLAARIPPEILPPFIEKLTNLKTRENSVDTSIPTTALRTLVLSFPRPVPGIPPTKATQEAYTAISKVLIPRLVGYIVINHGGKNAAGLLSHGMLQVYPDKGVDGDAIDLVVELVRCFGIMMYEPEKAALQRSMLEIFDNERVNSVTKKKAIVAISLLAVYFSEQSLSSFVLGVIDSLRSAHLTLPKRRQLLALIGSLARSIPQRLGPHIKALVPYVLSPLSKQDYDESFQEFTDEGALNPLVEDVKEAALVALEVCLSSCINDMRPFTEESINVGVRYVNYDPNIANDGSDEDMNDNNDTAENEEDLQDVDNEDEDFEEEGGMSDDDDTSWKVRRCATKVLYALIATRGIGDLLDDGTLYDRVAPALIACFKEREENVRLEVLATLAALIKQTGEGVTIRTTTNDDESYISAAIATNSRKRRRGGSDSSMFDANGTNSSKDLASPVTSPFPISGPKADLHRLSSLMIPGVAKILKQTPVPTKQAAVTLLKNFVLVQNGGLSEHLGRIADPIFDAISISSNLVGGSTSSAAGGAASATGSSLRIEALHLLGAICDTHSSTVIAPYIDKIIPLVVTAVKDTYFKVSSEALRVVESVVKVLTPPRSSDTGVTQQKTITALFDVILNRIQATDADVEVRQRSIHALGVLLSRTSATKLLPWKMREPAMNTLLERLRNETTRLASINAINLVALSSSSKGELEPVWVRKVALDLGAQLRKSDRILRGASLGALKSVAVNARYIAALDDETVNHLVAMLLPLMDPNDLSLLALALNVITELIKRNPRNVVNNDLNRALCNIVLVPISGQVLDAYLRVVETIGSEGSGLPLMQALLRDIGVTGDPTIVGTAIGTLLVSGSLTVGVQIDDFIKELRDAQDDLRKCLALSILGEAGLRLGASSPLKPDTFTPHFKSKSDRVPRAAAIALGRAGAGNPSAYLPVILKSMNAEGAAQYLLLHSLREILQYTGKARIDISDYTEEIWTKSLASSRIEDNKAIGAECIGKLVIIAPKTYLPLLQDHLQDTSPTIRGMAIQAVRFTFPDTDETLDEALKPVLVNMLMTMLGDSALDNRKLALTCLNSATHNKPRIVLPYLAQLMPLVLQDSKVNPELVREVKMGPFTHKVDDGLEVRKSAYETLNALMDSAFSRINAPEVFDRIIAGLEDEHDINILCNLMLTKMIALDPEETSRRLDPIAERFRAILAHKPKENAVKQEVEKASEASRGVLQVSVRLRDAFPRASVASASGHGQHWRGYWEWVAKDFKSQVQAIEMEMKSLAT